LNHTGSQRYRGRRSFTPDPKPEGYDPAVRTQAPKLYLEDTNLRAIGRLLGLPHQTVSNWVREAATALPAQITDATSRETIELDERYTSFQQKKHGLGRDGCCP
jgi:transposase-like protein